MRNEERFVIEKAISKVQQQEGAEAVSEGGLRRAEAHEGSPRRGVHAQAPLPADALEPCKAAADAHGGQDGEEEVGCGLMYYKES